MSLRTRIEAADVKGLASIATSLMLGGGPRWNGVPVYFTYQDVRTLFAKHRPEVAWDDVEEALQELDREAGKWDLNLPKGARV